MPVVGISIDPEVPRYNGETHSITISGYCANSLQAHDLLDRALTAMGYNTQTTGEDNEA